MHAAQEHAGQHQIGQEREPLRIVLDQAAVAGLAMFEQAPHDMEAMLNLRVYASFLVSCDHIPRRSMALFRAKAVLDELIAGFPIYAW